MTPAEARPGNDPPIRLVIRSVSKSYPGTTALDGVDLDLRAGEIHALAGQNGAGKSTLIRILAGVEKPDGGRFLFDGQPVLPSERALPIAFIHQDLALIETMTVAENLALYDGYRRNRFGLIDWKGVRGRATRLLEAMNCTFDPTRAVAELSMAERSMVAVARAVAHELKILVLDEPTAALPAQDVSLLFQALRRLQATGVAMLYVTHRMDEIFQLADRITVFRDGVVSASRPTGEFTPAGLIEAVTGRAIGQVFPSRLAPTPRALLVVEGLCVEAFGPIDLTLAEGEILALVGLRGAGHEEVGRAIFGAAQRSAGRVLLGGREIGRGIASSIRGGLGFVSGRRAEEAIAGSLTVRENVFLNPAFLQAGTAAFAAADRRHAAQATERFSIVPRDPERTAATLSGGNQQKVVLARWVAAGSRVLVLEEPTAGVDVGAKEEIYARISAMMGEGHGALLVSSDFEEVAGFAHRALVFDRGRIVAELTGGELTVGRISSFASSASQFA